MKSSVEQVDQNSNEYNVPHVLQPGVVASACDFSTWDAGNKWW